MTERDPLNDPEMEARVTSFLASGEDPNGYYVSADTLLRVIGEVEDVLEETRGSVIAGLQGLIVPGNFVDSLKLGMTFGELMAKTSDRAGVWKILQDVKNLDKVPVVNIRGKTVH